MTKRFKQLLFKYHDLPLEEQKVVFEEELKNWVGNEYDQIDDILLIGGTI